MLAVLGVLEVLGVLGVLPCWGMCETMLMKGSKATLGNWEASTTSRQDQRVWESKKEPASAPRRRNRM